MIDSRNLTDLHPCLQRGYAELVKRLSKLGYPSVGVSSTYRDFESQTAKYAQGRTKPGDIITNAKAGESPHNYRLAFDVFKNVVGHTYDDNIFFKVAGQTWMTMGGEWGGSWKGFVDSPHMEYTGGLTLANLQAGKRLTDNAKMPWELIADLEMEEEKVTQEEFDKMFQIAINRTQESRARLPVSDWAEKDWLTATNQKIFVGTDPRSFLTKEQCASVLKRLNLI